MRSGGPRFRPHPPRGLSAVLFLLFLLFPPLVPGPAWTGEWQVSPIRLDLGRDARSGTVTVRNEAAGPLHVQMKAFEWTQDPDGKDRYDETGEIVFFPRIMVFDKAGEKILRAGIKVPAGAKEKAYRLFIEEIPGPREEAGVSVAIAIRFGVPIFVKPLKEEPRGEIEPVALSGGTVSARIRNTGNVHFVISAVLVTGKNRDGVPIFSRELSGWYLLGGASRTYTTDLPREVCPQIAEVDIEVKTDKTTWSGHRDADASVCAP